MFENVQALDSTKHSNLKFNTVQSFSFARDLTMVPLSYAELARARRHYPIVFSSQGTPFPQALLAIKQGENAFVDDNGRWLADYIPAHVRRYPFILSKTDKGNDYTVCLDTDAPHFSEEQGDPLYTANGEPAEVLERARDFLQRYQQEMLETEKVGTLLQDHGVLVEKQFTVGKGEKKSTIKGFRTVDMGKVAELDDKTLADWVRRGIFGFIYAHLHSLDNIKALAAKQDIGGEKN